MSAIPPSTDPDTPARHKCPICGKELLIIDTACPQCGYSEQKVTTDITQLKRPPFLLPSSLPLQPEILEDDMQVMLQFLPSGSCFSLALPRPMILGRIATPPPDIDSLSLNHLHAYRHGVSSWHCRLERRDQHLYVTDLKSTNGTYLNGERISPCEEQMVQDGAELILGTLRMAVFFRRIGKP